ncbi:hypothetical protein GCM10022286_23390 [Gryllotalpicola daejeonensis]|uniref:Uncharacterized protein n=1 Tax=Gryllotalpicola daejeonensis TaxID=993087 RepID=A0ABP7ZLM6_9MICO
MTPTTIPAAAMATATVPHMNGDRDRAENGERCVMGCLREQNRPETRGNPGPTLERVTRMGDARRHLR